MTHSPTFAPKFRIGSGTGNPANGSLYVGNELLVGVSASSPRDTLNVVGHSILTGGHRYVYTYTEGSYGYNITLSGGWGGCFEENTLVQTPSGFTAIKDLVVDDTVVSYDVSTSTLTEATVLGRSSRIAPSHFVINGTIKVTGEHPVYTKSGFKEVGMLTKLDELFDGTNWISLTSVEKNLVPITVYNLAVSEPSTYFAGGILAHNKDTSSRPGGHAYVIGGPGSYGGASGNTYLGYDGTNVYGSVIVSNAYVLPNVDGTANQALKTDGFGNTYWGTAASPLTTKGDLFTFTTVDARLPVGTDDYILMADSLSSTGLNWGSPSNLTITKTRRYNFSTRFRVGAGATGAASGQIQDVPCVLFAQNLDQEAFISNELLPEVDLTTVNPILRVHWLINTAATVGTETVRVQLDLKYRADGEGWDGLYDETILQDITLPTGIAYVRGHTDFALDRTLLASDDGISVKLQRLGSADTYGDDWGVSQIWLVYSGVGGE